MGIDRYLFLSIRVLRSRRPPEGNCKLETELAGSRRALAQGVSDHGPSKIEHESTIRKTFQTSARTIDRATTESNARTIVRTIARSIARTIAQKMLE